MPRSKAAVAAAVLMMLAMLPLAAAPVAAKDQTAASQAAVLRYWTKDRIANAKPRDFVRNANGSG